MTLVDPDDDEIWRWVIEHHCFDPGRGERRPVVVAAYDNAQEFERELQRYADRVHREIRAGSRSGRESVSGRVLHPGYRAEQARAHMVRRAVEHGADPRALMDDGRLPPNMAMFGLDEGGRHSSAPQDRI
jgi:hypothetical protein